jgi:curved DNA-binding protein CbpA
MQTWYEILGVQPSATAAEIRSAWRDVARTCHPDKTDDPEKNRRFQVANEAKSILLDPDVRAAYDADLRRAEERAPHPRCPTCGLRLASSDAPCPLCIVRTTKKPTATPEPPKPRRRRRKRIRLDLDPELLSPAWAAPATSVDDLMANLANASTISAIRRARGTRLEIPVGKDLTVVIDQGTIRTLRGIARNVDAVGRIVKAVREWLR